MEERPVFTVGMLRDRLRKLPDDWEITFSGGLEFHGLAKSGKKTINLTFLQIVYKDGDGNWQVAPEQRERAEDRKKKRADLRVLLRRQAAKKARKSE